MTGRTAHGYGPMVDGRMRLFATPSFPPVPGVIGVFAPAGRPAATPGGCPRCARGEISEEERRTRLDPATRPDA